MAAVKMVDQEIAQYLPRLSPEQKQAVLGVVKTFAAELGWRDDKEYIAEMNRRFDEMENGKVKGYTLDELEAGARQAYKSRKRKKG